MEKVGRSDLQKLGGALRDLPVEQGLFFSATDYTRPAKQYAQAAEQITGKKIDLFHLKPSTEEDVKGRIKTVVIELTIRTPRYDKGRFEPVFTPEGQKKLEEIGKAKGLSGPHTMPIDAVYDAQGNTLTTVKQLTVQPIEAAPEGDAKGVWKTHGGHVKIVGELIEVEGIKYTVPFDTKLRELRITAEGELVLIIKDEKGQVDKGITDHRLKRVKFDENGGASL